MALTAPTSTWEAAFSQAAAGQRVTVRRGRRTVAVVPVADLARLEDLEAEEAAEDADLLAASLAAEAAAQAMGEEPVPWAEADQRLGEL